MGIKSAVNTWKIKMKKNCSTCDYDAFPAGQCFVCKNFNYWKPKITVKIKEKKNDNSRK
jgi:hypothetical protein